MHVADGWGDVRLSFVNVLLVYAHPEPRSLNGALRDITLATLAEAGHVVQQSDLYARGWKAVVDRADFPDLPSESRLRIAAASADAFGRDRQTVDVAEEQEKLLWADAVILQFPLWWFSMPAILKGWVDRVFAYGFGYGVGEHSERRWGDRYGEGTLQGKRAMLVVTAGGWASHYGPRGINGPIDDLLFPINHGILYYPGFDVLPPFVMYRADKVDEASFDVAAAELRERIRCIATTEPIAYRQQNAGDYQIPDMTLLDGLEGDAKGFGLHVAQRPD